MADPGAGCGGSPAGAGAGARRGGLRSGRNGELERQIIGVLNSDGRATSTAIGSALGESPRQIRDTMAQMTASGRLHQRTDLVRGASAWPVSAWYFLRVPASKIDGVTARLPHLDQLRIVSHTVGPYDLIMGVWLKSLAEVQRLEQHLEVKLSGVSTVVCSEEATNTGSESPIDSTALGRIIGPCFRSP